MRAAPTFPRVTAALALAALRHDDPPATDPAAPPAADPPKPTEPPKPVEPAKPTEPAKPEPPKPADPKDDDTRKGGERAVLEDLAKERKRRQEIEAELAEIRKAREDAEKRIQEFEDAKKSDLEKAQAAAERAAAREHAANLRAVTSELRSTALAADAADPSIVVDLLSRDPERYLTDSGVDTAAIEKAVTDLLAAKPLLKKPPAPAATEPQAPAEPAKPTVQPDPSQGAGRGGTTEVDFLKASRDDVAAALAAFNVKMPGRR